MKLNNNDLQSFEELPQGWSVTTLGTVFPLTYGKALKKDTRDESGTVPVYGSSGQVGVHSDALTKKPALIVGRKGSVKEEYRSPVPCWPIDTVYFVEERDDSDLKYFEYLLKGLRLSRLDKSTAVLGLCRVVFFAVVVVIAPLDQHFRFVAEIEKQFSRLDEAVANLKRVKANLKRYKAAVLKASFEGVVREWPESRFADVCQIVSGFAFKSVDFCESGLPAIKIANVGYSEFLWKDQEYLPQSFLSKYQSFVVRPGDLLLALTRPITNGTVKVCRYPDDAPLALLNQRVAVLRPSEKVKPEFMLGLLQSEIFKEQLNDALSETLQPNLSPVDLKKFSVRLPCVQEQLHMVDEVDRRLSIIRESDAQVDASLKRAERLRQSILTRTFSGGFGEEVGGHIKQAQGRR